GNVASSGIFSTEDLSIIKRAKELAGIEELYFHGGGGVIGDLDTADLACRNLALHSRWSVLSIDYRLGPEDPYPAALKDAVASFVAAVAEASRLKIEPSRLAVGGESFGGMLAAQVCRRVAIDGGPQPVGQLLIYPVCDHGAKTPSRTMFANGYILSQGIVDYFTARAFAQPSDALDEWASPLKAASLAGLPPAFVVTAGLDMLRDEGRAYVARLESDGVKAKLLEFPGLFHDFGSQMASSGPAQAAWTTLSEDWASWISKGSTGPV
ncbi:MAG: alpha/beta hydrolase, partial [Myxococcota bacterium]